MKKIIRKIIKYFIVKCPRCKINLKKGYFNSYIKYCKKCGDSWE